MKRSAFDTSSPAILAAVRDGAAFEEACRGVGVNASTGRTWLRRYSVFAGQVDAARRERKPSGGALTRAEFEAHLADRVRAGSVGAMKLWAELHPAESAKGPEDPF